MRSAQRIVVTQKRGEIRIEIVNGEGPQKPKRPWYHMPVLALSWAITGAAIANAIQVLELV